MKIGVISDTHSKISLAKDALSHLKSFGVEYIFHAGDFGSKEIPKLLKDEKLKCFGVFGNNDFHLQSLQSEYNIRKEPYYFEIEGVSCKLMHLPFFMTSDTEVVIYGHTHEFKSECINGTLFLNPGECCARNKPFSEYAFLEITKESFKVIYFKKDIRDSSLEEKFFEYPRSTDE